MAQALKIQKEIEIDLHRQLYNNIYVLTLVHPTSKHFKAVFQRDMFVKNNKAAFQHVLHFLLNVQNPKLFKQMITWPILDIKMEAQFRKQLMEYLKELNMTYANSGIPLLTTSHFISPGGYKITEFMFKLSEFVLLDYVQRNVKSADGIQLPVIADEIINIATKQLNYVSKLVDEEVDGLQMKYRRQELRLECAVKLGQEVMIDNPLIDRLISERQKSIEEYQTTIDAAFPNLNKNILFTQRNDKICQRLAQVEEYRKCLDECAKMIPCINENRILDKLNELAMIYNTKESKNDLIKYLQYFLELYKENMHLIKHDKLTTLGDIVEQIANLNNDISNCSRKTEGKFSELLSFLLNLDSVDGPSHNYVHNPVLSQKLNEILEQLAIN